MTPHLHPKSRSTAGLFGCTLIAGLIVVGIPHIFPCPAPRRTFADSAMTITADGQQLPRVRRRRQKDEVDSEIPSQHHPAPSRPMDEEVSTFFQMEAESEKMSHVTHECPIPKPKGVLGEILGFRNTRGSEEPQTSNDGQ